MTNGDQLRLSPDTMALTINYAGEDFEYDSDYGKLAVGGLVSIWFHRFGEERSKAAAIELTAIQDSDKSREGSDTGSKEFEARIRRATWRNRVNQFGDDEGYGVFFPDGTGLFVDNSPEA